MKVCPKCRSSYTDASLNFCLADGVALLDGESFAAENPAIVNSWQDAETLRDTKFFVSENARHTAANSGAPTASTIDAKTEILPRQETGINRAVYAIVIFLLAVGSFAAVWWITQNKSVSVANAGNSSGESPNFTRVAALSPEQDVQIKKEVADFVESWRKTNENRDIEKHIDHYANTLDSFYKESGISKNHVRADRQRAYEIYDSISMQVDNLKIQPESENSAVAVFDKSWTFKNPKKISTGSVEQELRVAKQNGKWLIFGEKDVLVHFINNRISPDADSASANQQSAVNSTQNAVNQTAPANLK